MAIRQPAKRRLTLDEFLDLPETEPASELIDGEVVQKPVAKLEHNRPVRRLIRILDRDPYATTGEWITEQGVNFLHTDRGNHRVPDLCWYSPEVPLPARGYPETPPTLAVEVRSEGQSLRFLQSKLAFLREHGSSCTLLIDPHAETVEVHDGNTHLVARGDDVVRLETLRGLQFSASDLFQN